MSAGHSNSLPGSARLSPALQSNHSTCSEQSCVDQGSVQRQNDVNLKLRVCITYHSRCTGKRKEPISTCPAPFKIHSYAFFFFSSCTLLQFLPFISPTTALQEKWSCKSPLLSLCRAAPLSLSILLAGKR